MPYDGTERFPIDFTIFYTLTLGGFDTTGNGSVILVSVNNDNTNNGVFSVRSRGVIDTCSFTGVGYFYWIAIGKA